mmetsp:Transcript_41001/g.39537  ORF Transcript_41001/g.39537 Transcript_41001/m.39537 type:complete len:112 (+) Transcript_41001:90-425(+)
MFSRIFVNQRKQACLINVKKKVIMPWERHSAPVKLLRFFFFSMINAIIESLDFKFTRTKLMERMNLLHYGVNQYTDEVLKNAEYAYPLLKVYNVQIDSREELDYDLDRLHN